ncbi:MAG: branched-chain amino acid transport system substrate-binding protein [Acetobacteraceae bacterium]|jgi:branched-chain amino acid transport system substrate-binding protein|nr:branched-chain amino acid transport system substrate-binding protein [Acetobacteraceae bacterium]
MKQLLIWAAVLAAGLYTIPEARAQDDVIKLGISAPMSGAAASWGIGADWVGQQAVKEINEHGGITAAGKTYKLQLTSYENGYNSADGGKAAQAMLNRDHVRFIIQGIGTAPMKSLQSLSERQGALLMQIAWGKSVKGPQAPLTFTNSNTPFELFGPLFDLVKRAHPEAKTVALLNPNDATGQEVEEEAVKQYKARGFTILASTWYERGTTEFQPIATKLAQSHADIMDLSGAPPADSGTVYKELAVQGWKGIKVQSSGTGADAMVKVGGAAVEDTYMGNAADFGGPTATPIQQRLNAGALKALNEPANILHMGAWDATMAIKAGIEKANSIDPKVVARTLPTIIFESSYGPTAFGGKDTYGSPQQMLVPIIVTQIKNGQTVEIERIIPDELKQRLAAKQ